jgi:small subunit ribosomal protein S4
MARNLDPKCKQCRRVGEKLFLKGERCFTPKCPIVKRNYPPGMHGNKSHTKSTEYGMQMREKQKMAKTYRILEKQFRGYYTLAKQMSGDTGENLVRLLEMRLDNVVHKLGFAPSRDAARQLVNHGMVTVNGKRVDIASFQTKINDVISIRTSKIDTKPFQELVKKLDKQKTPTWLAVTNDKKIEGKVIAQPMMSEMQQGINPAVIVEFYSR